MRKILSVISILLFACALITSCVNQEARTDYDLAKGGKSSYSIIRPAKASKEELDVCLKLQTAIEDAAGVKLEIFSDEDSEISGNEILFGFTNREESLLNAEGLEMDDYRLASYGEKLVISGYSAKALSGAVDYISENFLSNSDIVLAKDLLYTYTTPIKTYVMAESKDKYKVMGRSAVYGDAISADWSAGGIEFIADCKNDVIINVSIMPVSSYEAGTYFTVYIDGKRIEERLLALSGTTDITIAAGLEEGVHSFKFFKQAHSVHCAVNINSITVEGKLLEKPADRDLYNKPLSKLTKI